MFSVSLCARFQSNPIESHLKAVKWILRYLKGSSNLELFYPKSNKFDLVAYTDADYDGCKIDRKNTSGSYQFLGNCLISWSSRKQNTVALSSTEAKYVVVGSCAQILGIKHQFEDYRIILHNIPIKCDNTSAISLTKKLIFHARKKHIEVKHHFIRDHVQKGYQN